jgi:hypothetical protein
MKDAACQWEADLSSPGAQLAHLVKCHGDDESQIEFVKLQNNQNISAFERECSCSPKSVKSQRNNSTEIFKVQSSDLYRTEITSLQKQNQSQSDFPNSDECTQILMNRKDSKNDIHRLCSDINRHDKPFSLSGDSLSDSAKSNDFPCRTGHINYLLNDLSESSSEENINCEAADENKPKSKAQAANIYAESSKSINSLCDSKQHKLSLREELMDSCIDGIASEMASRMYKRVESSLTQAQILSDLKPIL